MFRFVLFCFLNCSGQFPPAVFPPQPQSGRSAGTHHHVQGSPGLVPRATVPLSSLQSRDRRKQLTNPLWFLFSSLPKGPDIQAPLQINCQAVLFPHKAQVVTASIHNLNYPSIFERRVFHTLRILFSLVTGILCRIQDIEQVLRSPNNRFFTWRMKTKLTSQSRNWTKKLVERSLQTMPGTP